ncbi:hypothetical protein [Nocardiopsis sp. YSL2]|uniref:hypothetical protein n=1 Tax=Nocardiopsis sp. YSL2 TaxID=2939492 RepID=UPI0026F451B2|nr:hypothetical protein [Nocardiopsis sp. YSL2]
MHQPSGRHRRPSRSLAERVRRVAAALLAAALAYVFVPQTTGRRPPALVRAPERAREAARTTSPGAAHCAPPPDEDPGALVRPYMPPFPPPPIMPVRPLPVPRPRLPEGDLLAAPARPPDDDLGELTAAVRAWLDMTRRADRP